MQTGQFESWLTKEQATERIGISRRTLEHMARDRKLETGKRKAANGLWNVVFNPEDVERIAHQRNPSRAFLVPVAANAVAPRQLEDAALAFADALAAIVRRPRFTEQRWMLTIAEAVDASGWSEAIIRRGIKSGALLAVKDGGWKIHREDLARFCRPR